MKQRRYSKQRAHILDVVRMRDDHPSADDIFQAVRKESPHISRGTVYRNLNLLVEDGTLGQVKVPGFDRFDRRSDFHYHLLCTQCGITVDLPLPYQKEMDARIEDETGFSIEKHNTIFEGICPACLSENETPS